MSGARRQRARRAFAITTALLWLLGVEVLPNLHLAVHGDDHTHRVDGTIVHRAAPGEGAQAARAHGHAHDHAHARAGDHGGDHAHAHAGARPHRHPRPYPSLPGARPAPAKRHRPAQLAIEAPRDGHAAAGLAHHAVALHAPPPPVLAPVGAPAVARWRYPAPHARPRATTTLRPTARGPPAA